MHISWKVKIRNLVKALKYIPEQKSHLTRAILPQNKAFYQENQANENLPRNYYYACPLYCAHSLWSCNKILSGRGQGYFCARDEMSILFSNLRAWNLYMSPLICRWSMKSTKCFFFVIRNMFWIWHTDQRIVELNSRYLTLSAIPASISDRQAITKALKLCLIDVSMVDLKYWACRD